VIAPTTRRTRVDVSAETGLTSFVGRDRELELLLDGFERAKEGSGQAFSIIGEAGIGKSRFLYEFRKAVSSEDITFLEGKCLSYSKGVPYHSIVDVLRGNFDIAEGDIDERIRNKVKRSLEALKVDEAGTLPYLLELLGVKDSGIDRMQVSPEGLKDRIIEAVKEIIIKGAIARPLVIAIEDLHWADKSSEDALKWLLEAVPGARVLILFTYRPEFVHTWGGRSYHNQISLNRLSNRESLVMVSHLLGTDAVDPELERLILGKTEGVPFFIEEFVKSLQGLGLIKREDGRVLLQGDPQSLAISSTIQDMIMARVDRLQDEARAVLQTGSAIEREFSHDLIRAVTGLTEGELLRHLSALKDAELLYERGVYPQTSYIFRHALTREVVYSSILSQRRRELHAQIGAAIEDMHRENLSKYYEILCEHFSQGGDFAKAAGYAKSSAKRAEKSASVADAAAYARKRILYLEELPASEEGAKERIDARTVLGLYLLQLNHWVAAKDAVEPVIRLARDMGYRKRIAQMQSIMGTYYGLAKEDFPKALEAFDEALRIAAEEKDYITLIMASAFAGISHALDCNFENAKRLLQHAVDINVAAKSLWGISSQKAQLAFCCHFLQGDRKALKVLSSEALKIAKQSGDPISMGISNLSYGRGCYAEGDFKDAVEHAVQAKNILERIGMYGWAAGAWLCLAESYFEMKGYPEARQCYEGSLGNYEKEQIMPSWMNLAQLGVARCDVMLGEKQPNVEWLRSAYGTIKLKAAKGWVCRYLGEIFLNLGDPYSAEAEQWMQEAIKEDARNRMQFHLGLDHALYGEFFKRQGDRTRAQEQLEKAIEILRGCGADGWVEKYSKELAALQ
jgi:tetratricopeptide (TPR) repeat protein